MHIIYVLFQVSTVYGRELAVFALVSFHAPMCIAMWKLLVQPVFGMVKSGLGVVGDIAFCGGGIRSIATTLLQVAPEVVHLRVVNIDELLFDNDLRLFFFFENLQRCRFYSHLGNMIVFEKTWLPYHNNTNNTKIR